ncbi:hypothetical protein [Asticcacaulis taihuensis]|uniref:hypothetical protein n=1 Tax=Asticcacaulis taihuensis TaxID=260084 RepID=UPI003F7BBDFA
MKILAFAFLCAGLLAPSVSAQVLLSSTPVPANEIMHVRRLGFSPDSSFVIGRYDNKSLLIIKTACLMTKDYKACPAFKINAFNAPTTYFWREPYILSYVQAGGSVQEYDLSCLFSGKADCGKFVHQFDDPKWMSDYFSIFPGTNDHFYATTQAILTQTQGATAGNIGENARDVYGLIHGSRFFYLHRDNNYTMKAATVDTTDVLFDPYGQAYDSRYENLDFRQDEDHVYVLASGSVLQASPDGRFRNLTIADKRAGFIQDSDLSAYVGYFTADAFRPVNMAPNLTGRLQTFVGQHPGVFIVGGAVERNSGNLIVSYKSRIEDFDAYTHPLETGGNSYSHYIEYDGRAVTLSETIGKPLRYRSQKICSPACLWVDSYEIDPSAKTVVFVPGGPDETVDIVKGDGIRTFLDNGLNIDVVHYGGSLYTYDLATRLNRRGLASLRNDAAAIQTFVAGRYPDRRNVALVMSSFGGMYYRFLDPAFLKSLGMVVLDRPAGSVKAGFNQISPVIAAHYAKVMGDHWPGRFDNAWYDRQTTCQISSPTWLIYALGDENVDPRYDYRNCLNSPLLKLKAVDGGHDAGGRETFDLMAYAIKEGFDAIPSE